jgi:quercetin dioxygenase-like cupin family protein
MPGKNKTAAGLTAEKANLSELVDYQQGAVVSKTLINKKTGTVTLFSFDEGESLSEHTAQYDALVYIIEGEAEINVSGEKNVLKSGEIIIMPANEPHSLKALSKFKMMLVMVKS